MEKEIFAENAEKWKRIYSSRQQQGNYCLGFAVFVEETKVFPCEPDRGNIWEEVCGN